MSILKSAAVLVGAACALGAQVPIDLNGLVTAAKAYTDNGLRAERNPASLDLRLVRGDNGGNAATLMSTASDVKRWTVFYDFTYPGEKAQGNLPLPQSASVECLQGNFSGFELDTRLIPDCKSMQFTWFAVDLDAAVSQLNAGGYVRGFSKVELKRPEVMGLSDEATYIFTCPWERTLVGISASSGTMLWYQMY